MVWVWETKPVNQIGAVSRECLRFLLQKNFLPYYRTLFFISFVWLDPFRLRILYCILQILVGRKDEGEEKLGNKELFKGIFVLKSFLRKNFFTRKLRAWQILCQSVPWGILLPLTSPNNPLLYLSRDDT